MTSSDIALQNSKGSHNLGSGSPNLGSGSPNRDAGSQNGGAGSGMRRDLAKFNPCFSHATSNSCDPAAFWNGAEVCH